MRELSPSQIERLRRQIEQGKWRFIWRRTIFNTLLLWLLIPVAVVLQIRHHLPWRGVVMFISVVAVVIAFINAVISWIELNREYERNTLKFWRVNI